MPPPEISSNAWKRMKERRKNKSYAMKSEHGAQTSSHVTRKKALEESRSPKY